MSRNGHVGNGRTANEKVETVEIALAGAAMNEPSLFGLRLGVTVGVRVRAGSQSPRQTRAVTHQCCSDGSNTVNNPNLANLLKEVMLHRAPADGPCTRSRIIG